MADKFKLEGIVVADLWDETNSRFVRRDYTGLTAGLNTFLYLPEEWFKDRLIERVVEPFVEGFYKSNSGLWGAHGCTVFLARKSPAGTALDNKVYVYELATDGAPSLEYLGETDWNVNHSYYELVMEYTT